MPMLRHRRFLQVMHRLALIGVLLMVVAPLVSRWVQSSGGIGPLTQLVALCGGHGPQPARPDHAMHHDMAAMEHAGMKHAGMAPAGHAMPMAMDMSMPMDHGDGGMPPDHDGAACDYCLLAARLLPFVLVLLLLPMLRATAFTPGWIWAMPRIAAAWPAHAARGPPLPA